MIEFNRPSPSNAHYVLEALREEEEQAKQNSPIIDLYPYIQESNEYGFIQDYYEREKEERADKEYNYKFLNAVDEAIAFHCIYNGILEPVLEEMYCTSHQKELGARTVLNYINEHGGYNVIDNLKYKGRYLLEMATIADLYKSKIINEAKDKVCHGLTYQDACEIEDGDIKGLVIDVKGTIPKDVLKSISNKVEDSIVDFIDDNKKSKYQIKKIYDDAKAKIIKSTDDTGEDMSMIDMNPEEIQQEAMAQAKARERAILENSPCNLFKAMSSILLESVYKIKPIKESYTKSNGKIDFKKVLDDTTVLYTFLECLNTLNIENIDEQYLNNMLKDMKKSIHETSVNQVSSIGTIDKKSLTPKKDDEEDEDDLMDQHIQSVTSKNASLM